MEKLKSPKAIQKKILILTSARDLFIEKGFVNVTMQDIVLASNISRGGLYLYFKSTKEIFMEIYKSEVSEIMESVLLENQNDDISSIRVIKNYFSNLQIFLFDYNTGLSKAAYECFQKNKHEQIIFQWQFDNLVETLRQVLNKGVNSNEFNNIDCDLWAQHLALMINGMSLLVPVLQFSRQRFQQEIDFILSYIINKESF